MERTLPLVIVIVVALGVLIVIARTFKALTGRGSSDRLPLYAKKLLHEREQVLYWRLVSAFPDHIVLAQVAFSQLVGVEKYTKNRQAVFNRVRQLCADFVICDPSFTPLAVVELDGTSHDHPRRAEADRRKDRAVESAGLALLRVKAVAMPNEAALRMALPQVAQKKALDDLVRVSEDVGGYDL